MFMRFNNVFCDLSHCFTHVFRINRLRPVTPGKACQLKCWLNNLVWLHGAVPRLIEAGFHYFKYIDLLYIIFVKGEGGDEWTRGIEQF